MDPQHTAPITESSPVTAVAQLAEQVRRVHALRLLQARCGDLIADARRAFDVSHAEEILELKMLKDQVDAAEAALRTLALAHYTTTGEAKPTAGIEVKIQNVFTVTDLAAALAWARKSEMCLIPESVDTKALLKVASVTPLPFVRHTTEPKAQIGSDLEKVLGGVQ